VLEAVVIGLSVLSPVDPTKPEGITNILAPKVWHRWCSSTAPTVIQQSNPGFSGPAV
jgi:hypothetical protein